jgi:hypothetical protein
MPTRSRVEHGGSCLMSGVKSESSPYASRRTLVVEDYLLVCLSLTLICDCALFATGPTISDKNLQEVLRDDASLWCLTIGRVAQLAPFLMPYWPNSQRKGRVILGAEKGRIRFSAS